MFCINFEDDDLVNDNMGVYRPWIMNDGVKIIDDPNLCIEGRRCGFFNMSRLEIPMFSNMYSNFEALRIFFYYKIVPGGSADQGIISNDCYGGATGAPGNSIYCSLQQQSLLQCGLNQPGPKLGGGVSRSLFTQVLLLGLCP